MAAIILHFKMNFASFQMDPDSLKLWYSHVHELISFALAAWCLRHSWKRNINAFFFVIGAMIYGVALEVVTIVAHHAYNYGNALIMVGPVPLYIGASWGFIMYSALLITDDSSVVIYHRPVIDASIAVLLDLAMDPVCVSMKHWNWLDPRANQFFGVPKLHRLVHRGHVLCLRRARLASD